MEAPMAYQMGILIPSQDAGRLIGKAGAGLKQVREMSQCQVKLGSDPDSQQNRRCDIGGPTVEHIASAVHAIGLRLFEGPSASVKMMVAFPNDYVGGIIGKGAANLKHIRESTGVGLTLEKGAMSDQGDRVGQLVGVRDQLGAAIRIALNGARATVASGCNHLFHKVCLIEASLEGLDDVDEAIFDNSFFQAQGASEVEEVALLCLMRERIGSRRVELEDERTQLCTARERLEVQQRKLRAQQSCKRKREEEALKLKKEIRSLVEPKLNHSWGLATQSACEQHDQISGELNQVRQRDAILEYWEALRHGKDDEALQKLIKLVGLVSHPWKMLSHVARLRDHFRKQRDHHDRDRALADQREKRAKREIAELERRGAECLTVSQQRRSGDAIAQLFLEAWFVNFS
eukprot:g31601.t1